MLARHEAPAALPVAIPRPRSTPRRAAVAVTTALAVVSLAGCGSSPSAPPNDAGGAPDAGGGHEDAAVARIDAGSDAGLRSDAGPGSASVAWVTTIEPLTIDSDVALDFAYRYELAIEGDPFAYSLSVERCVRLAGHDPSCATQPLSNLPGAGAVRWGLDPTMYAIGENHYSFRLVLARAGTTVDEDLLDLRVDVTACTSCGGAPGA